MICGSPGIDGPHGAEQCETVQAKWTRPCREARPATWIDDSPRRQEPRIGSRARDDSVPRGEFHSEHWQLVRHRRQRGRLGRSQGRAVEPSGTESRHADREKSDWCTGKGPYRRFGVQGGWCLFRNVGGAQGSLSASPCRSMHFPPWALVLRGHARGGFGSL